MDTVTTFYCGGGFTVVCIYQNLFIVHFKHAVYCVLIISMKLFLFFFVFLNLGKAVIQLGSLWKSDLWSSPTEISRGLTEPLS